MLKKNRSTLHFHTLNLFLLAFLLAGCESTDQRPDVQSSYSRIEAEIVADRDSSFSANPYNYQMNFDTEKSVLSLERRERPEDLFVFILFPLIIPDRYDTESAGSLYNVKISKYAKLNGQIFMARHFSRPIRISEEGLLSDYQWIDAKPTKDRSFSLDQVRLNPDTVTLTVLSNRVLVNYPIVGHSSPTQVKFIASSEYFFFNSNAEKFKLELEQKLSIAKEQKKKVNLVLDEDSDLTGINI